MVSSNPCGDLPRLLRDAAHIALSGPAIPLWPPGTLCNKAADEIDRLSGQVRYVVQQFDPIVGEGNNKPVEALVRSVVAMYERLQRELDETQKLAESLQNRWASRPLDHPSGEALMRENDRLRRERNDPRYPVVRAERDRYRAALVGLSTEAEGLKDAEWVRKRVAVALRGAVER
jgi:hypothetical protein